MKWKAIEPKEGDFITDVPDNMIAWAKKNNITVRGYLILDLNTLFRFIIGSLRSLTSMVKIQQKSRMDL